MNTSQLECMIDCDPALRNNVVGVYAADQLPQHGLGQPYGFIANTDPRLLPGQHWCAFYGDGRGHVQFFDSYGRFPGQNSAFFAKWLFKNDKTVRVNQTQIQSENSTVCGLYCVMFLHEMFTGETMEDFVNIFDSTRKDVNDSYVFNLITNTYSECLTKNNGQMCTTLCKKI